MNVEAVLRSIENGLTDEAGFPVALNDLDRALAAAAQRDVRSLLSEVLSRELCLLLQLVRQECRIVQPVIMASLVHREL